MSTDIIFIKYDFVFLKSFKRKISVDAMCESVMKKTFWCIFVYCSVGLVFNVNIWGRMVVIDDGGGLVEETGIWSYLRDQE